MKWLNLCRSINDYDECTIEYLIDISKRMKNEFRQCYNVAYNRVNNNVPVGYGFTDLYELQKTYQKEIDKLEYKINNRRGIYSFYSLDGQLIDDVISNDFLELQKYNLPIKIELFIAETRTDYDLDYEDITDIERIIKDIKKRIDYYKDKKYLQIKIRIYACRNISAVDGYYRTFNNKYFKIKENWT